MEFDSDWRVFDSRNIWKEIDKILFYKVCDMLSYGFFNIEKVSEIFFF